MTETETNNSAPTANVETKAAPAGVSRGWTAEALAETERSLHPYQRWLVVLVTTTIAAACLLISAGHGAKDGTQPWSPNSVLRVIVELLNFNYAFPTFRGNDVKWLAQGLGAAAALMTAGIVWYIRTGRRKEVEERREPSGESSTEPTAGAVTQKGFFEQISLVGAAQLSLLAFGAWAIYSYRWAHWPAAAVGEGLRHLIVIIWAVALGRTMNRWSAQRAGVGMSLVLTVTAVIGIWYHFERNPFMRLEFPIGNPIFFAACMLPALMLAFAGIAAGAERILRGRPQEGTAVRAAKAEIAPVWMLCGSAAVLLVVGWAFVLTDSRAPQVALLAGLGAGGAGLIIRWLPRHRRRLALLGFLVVGLGAVVFVGLPWLEAQQSVAAGGRGASFRMRLYTWQYARDLFLSRPLSGRGQGSYLCLAQEMAFMPRDQWGRSHAEQDPTAFAAGLVGHAHNEWLEILAELGAVGFALMATGLGLTFWAGWRAFMRAEAGADRWFVLGLMATLLAIVVEECADVALRMPVLPLIFYTVIGLLWAGSKEAQVPAASQASSKGWLRPVGLVAAVLGTMTISSLVRRDWRGALADGRVPELLEKQQWDVALQQADIAGQNRLVLESLISANLKSTQASHAAATHRFEQFRSMLARQSAPADRGRIRAIAEEDIARFDEYASRCLASGGGLNTPSQRGLWQNVPAIHSVANWMADVLLMKSEVEALKQEVGLEPERAPFLQTARRWFELEYQRDRFNAAAALRLLGMSGNAPMEYRIDLLRIPLRLGPEPLGSSAGIEAALAQMMATERPSFDRSMEPLLQRAAQAAGGSDPDRWPDPYAPETLRLKAMAERQAGRYQEAAEFAGRAVALYGSDDLRFHYPTALACGLGELAKHEFLADPEQPRKAAELCRRAIESWPAAQQGEGRLEILRRDLSLYYLAAGDEEGAAELIRRQVRTASQESLQRNLGYGLAELCGMFIDRAPQARPGGFRDWLARSLTLAPAYPNARWLAARVSLEEGQTQQAVDHLKVLQSNVEDPRQVAPVLESLARLYPDNAELKRFIETWLSAPDNGEGHPASGPADEKPNTGNPESAPK